MYESSGNDERHDGRKLQGERVPVTVYVEPEMYDAIKDRAKRSDRSISYVLRRAIRRHLKATERRDAA